MPSNLDKNNDILCKENTKELLTPYSDIDMDRHWHRQWLAACRKFLSMASPWSSTHCGLVALHGDIDLGQHWLRYLACCLTAPSNYMNQRWLVISKVQYGILLRAAAQGPSVLQICLKITTKISFTHYSDVIMSAILSQITGVSIVYLAICSGADQRKHQSSASLAFVRGIHRWPVNSPHKGPVTRKMFPFDDVIMISKGIMSLTCPFLAGLSAIRRRNSALGVRLGADWIPQAAAERGRPWLLESWKIFLCSHDMYD